MSEEQDQSAAQATHIDPELIARAAEADHEIVVLPDRYVDGKGVYPQSTVMVVKELRQLGVDAVFLDPPERRTFEMKKSAVAALAIAFGISLGASAAWDGIKALFRTKQGPPLSVTFTELNAGDASGKAWKVEGDADAVLQAIEKLQGTPEVREVGPAAGGEVSGPLRASGPDDDLRESHISEQVQNRRVAGDDLIGRAKQLLTDGEKVAAEKAARAALALYARSLDWAEDTDDEEEAHRVMDDAGTWVRETFGCQLARNGTEYRQACPVALAHNRIGLSVGGSAVRVCSLCGEDLSECPHMPGTAYVVPGGPAELGWCRVCLQAACEHASDTEYRVSVVSIVKEMEVEEISLVSKPANPEARIHEMSVPISELQELLGAEFVPGTEVSCDRCLNKCAGLTRHPEDGEAG